ncbi:hypothetical protein C8P66_1253 [Humitalea rosea]|uniref:Uncharacterized protein n=1 Tax=Humitalea rosea TaxID=990373 RepID=A0A2W7I4E3_9PROT|nr:hypothetical protein [Humitalea rosea]PZW40035.1 hypothetical protein C8P66_1253 [Humitalea rosea]
MPDLASAFPRRALTLRQPLGLWRVLLLAGFGALLAFGALFWLSMQIGPDLVSDFQIRDNARPLGDARLVSGRCTTHLGILHDCDVTLRQDSKARAALMRDVHYLFADFHTGAYVVSAVLGDPDRPGSLTTDIGMDRLWNRLVLLLIAGVLVVTALIGLGVYVRTAMRQRRLVRSLSGRVLSPVPLRLAARAKGNWVVQTRDGQRQSWQVSPRAKPFLLDPAQGLILGVTAPGTALAFPVDDKLAWLALEPAEQLALQAFRAPG